MPPHEGEISTEQLPDILQDLERVEFRLSTDLKRRLLEQTTQGE
jgi:hypothetical protein